MTNETMSREEIVKLLSSWERRMVQHANKDVGPILRSHLLALDEIDRLKAEIESLTASTIGTIARWRTHSASRAKPKHRCCYARAWSNSCSYSMGINFRGRWWKRLWQRSERERE